MATHGIDSPQHTAHDKGECGLVNVKNMLGGYPYIAYHEQHNHGRNHTVLNSTNKKKQLP
jgi:hypothetical protein